MKEGAHELEARVRALLGSPFEHADPLGVGIVTRLYARAAKAPEPLRARIEARVEAQLLELEARHGRTRARAVAAIEQLEQEGIDASPARSALERGQVLGARRMAIRIAKRPFRERGGEEALRTQLARFAAKLGVSLEGSERLGATRVARRLFRIARSGTEATRVVELAQAARPDDAGRYHTDTVAADVLAAMQAISPAYLRAQLAKLELQATLAAFIAEGKPPEAPEPDKPARKARQRKKR